MASAPRPLVGVLGLQGSFREHMAALERAGAEAVEVRTPRDLKGLSGLVLPGGESTTIAHVCGNAGLMPPLRALKESGVPVWGTCAGLIFLAGECVGASEKKGGQALLGGLDVTVHRNFFGSQVSGSFETTLLAPPCLAPHGGTEDFRAVFIRAPAIVRVGEGVETLCELPLAPERQCEVDLGTRGTKFVDKVAIACRRGSLLTTSFHPELTTDTRWHSFFVAMCRESGKQFVLPAECKDAPVGHTPRGDLYWGERPADCPVFTDKAREY